LGNRYQQTLDSATTTFSLDLAAGLTQVLSDGSSTSLYGLGRIGEDDSGGWGFHLADALGSVRQIANDSGRLTLTQSFEPFGSPMTSSGDGSSGFGFTGEQDAAGLVFLRARFYDPAVGRFLTKDPFPGYASLPSTLNPYAYALNNPASLVDPSGNFAFAAFLFGAVANGILSAGMSAISYLITNPGHSLGDYLSTDCFLKDLAVGFASGFITGLFTGFFGGLGIFQGLRGAALLGGISGGLFSGFREGLSQFASSGKITDPYAIIRAGIVGAIVGAIFGAIGYRIGQYIRGTLAQKYIQSLERGNPSPIGAHAISKHGPNASDWHLFISSVRGNSTQTRFTEFGQMASTIRRVILGNQDDIINLASSSFKGTFGFEFEGVAAEFFGYSAGTAIPGTGIVRVILWFENNQWWLHSAFPVP
jgi:RHS repeat-associated protein